MTNEAKRKSNLRVAFDLWCGRHPYVQQVPLYRAVLRSRNCPLRTLRAQPIDSIENELHVLLLGFAMMTAGAYTASRIKATLA